MTIDTHLIKSKPDINTIWVFSGVHHNRKKWLHLSQKAPIRIDCFFWGILLFKEDQAQESFSLRIV